MSVLTPKERHYAEILEINNDLVEALRECEDAKEVHNECKARVAKLQARSMEITRRGPSPQMLMRFLQEEHEAGQSTTEGEPSTDTTAEPPAAEPTTETPAAQEPQRIDPNTLPADHWRLRPVRVLGITEGLVTKLEENNITFLGDLMDFWHEGRFLTECNGIGAEKSGAIADAFASYAKLYPEVYGEEFAAAHPPDPSTPVAATESTPAAETEADVIVVEWRDRSLGQLDVAPTIINRLFDAGIDTLGKLYDLWAADRSLIVECNISGASNQKVVLAWNNYCAEHSEVPLLPDQSLDKPA